MVWEIADAIEAIGLFDGQAAPAGDPVLQGNGVAAFTRNGVGDYTIALDQPQAPTTTLVQASPVAGNFAVMSGAAQPDGTVRVFAYDPRSAAPVDVITFQVVVMVAPASVNPQGTLPAPVIPPVGVGSLQTAYNGGPLIEATQVLGPVSIEADAGDPPDGTQSLLELDGTLVQHALRIIQRFSGDPADDAIILANALSNTIRAIDAAAGSDTFGATLVTRAGNGDLTGVGGGWQSFAGQGGDTGVGGTWQSQAGDGGATSGDGGDWSASAGSSNLGDGGDGSLQAGNAFGDGDGGDLTESAGSANGVGNGGDWEGRAGSNTGGDGNGGRAGMRSGQGAGSGTGGNAEIIADRGGTNQGAGDVKILVVGSVGAASDGGNILNIPGARSGTGAQGVWGLQPSDGGTIDHSYGQVDRHLASRSVAGTLGVAVVTTAERDAMATPAGTCLIVYNSTTAQLERNPGGAGWAAV